MKDRLPEGECAYLGTLSGAPLKARARALHQSGWSLAAIAEAFDPPRQRSSVRAWVLSNVPAPDTQPPLPPSPSSSSSSSSSYSSIIARESSVFSSAKTVKTKTPRRVYNPASPRISSTQKNKIATLAPLARRYRARTSPNGTYARANNELTDLCKNLYYKGTSVRELSLAAGVTYRAMARRLGR
jgi:lambda repressor-like predicted transcriptional regulator